MNQKFEYIAEVVTLPSASNIGTGEVRIPDGRCIAIGAVVSGNDDNEIINLSLLENGNAILKPADVRFSEKTNGGNFVQSLRPVDLTGGRMTTIVLQALTASRATDVKVQVLFMVEKPDGSVSC